MNKPRPLSHADAKRAVEAAWAHYSQRLAKYGPSLRWNGPSEACVGFTARGMSFDSKLRIADRSLEFEMDVPLLLRPFAKPAITMLEQEVGKWVKQVQTGG